MLIRFHFHLHLLGDVEGNVVLHGCGRTAVDIAVIAHQSVLLNQVISTACGHILGDLRGLQKFEGSAKEIMFLQTQMTFHFCFGDGVHQCLIHPFRRYCRKAQTHCQFVGSLECDARHLHQSVGVIANDIQGVLAVLPVDFDGPVCGNTVRGQKSDHITGTTGGQIRIADLLKPLFADAPNGHKLFRLPVEDLQCVLPKGIVDQFCDLPADTFDLSGGQISDDSFLGMGNHFFVALYLELQTVPGMFCPMSVKTVAHFLCDGQTIADSFYLTEHITRRVPDDFQRTVDGDHIVNGRGIGSTRIKQFFKLT